MKALLLISVLAAAVHALINDIKEDCIVITPIGNTIVTAGEEMKIMWTNSHAEKFSSIYLVQSDGSNQKPIVLASDVDTKTGKITLIIDYMTLGEAPNHCNSGNLRIVGANSVMPEPKTPGGLDNQISSGRFPKSASSAHSFIYLPITIMVTVLASFVFMFSV
ncbi:hypothetical protein BD770DRAFT_475944 [Pilaira anomala]|nr:hypothetical protein BD770DRAFT_475944 [Pilaira anomala]